LQPVTDAFQLKIRRAAMQSHFVCIKKIQLFSAVFYAVRAVDKFELTLVINGERKKKSGSDRGSRV
jgi:hypothetical protein